MRGLIVGAVLVLLPVAGSVAQAAIPSPIPKPQPSLAPHSVNVRTNRDIAPADAYFGSMGLSPLSIRSMIGFLGRQYHYRTISDHDLLRKALLTEDSLRKWRAQYPADPWLPPTFFHLEQLYQAVQTDEARKHATQILKDTIRYYPNTKEGHLSRSRLAAGFPPLVPESPLVATPPPTAAPSAEPSATGTASPQAGASGQPAPATGSSAPPAANAMPSPAGSATAAPPSPAATATASPK